MPVAEKFLHVALLDSVRDLEVTLDQELCFSQHINQLTLIISYVKCWLFLAPYPMTMIHIHAFVTSRLYHCSSILVGLPLGLIGRLDRVLR